MLYLGAILAVCMQTASARAASIDSQLTYRTLPDVHKFVQKQDSQYVSPENQHETERRSDNYKDTIGYKYLSGLIDSPFLDPEEATRQHWDSSASCAGTKFAFASYYGSHMVLQSSPARAFLWGYAGGVGDTVTVTHGGRTYTTHSVTGPTGVAMWVVGLDPTGTGPDSHNITASSSGCTLTLQDVLFGDVWICSGQSNMAFPVSWAWDPKPLAKKAPKYPNVRTFQAANAYSNTTLYDLKAVGQAWMRPTAAKMMGFSAVCWMYGMHLADHLKRPIGLIQTTWGGTRVEAWSSPRALATCFPHGPSKGGSSPNKASYLWNAMIHPFLNMTIYGAIWYQGEANIRNPKDYACAFPEMIKDWRQYFNAATSQTDPEFPFGFVQLAPNMQNSTNLGTPELRFAQTANYGYVPNPRMPRVFMAVAMDLPDFNAPFGAIHPRYKLPVGRRLALAGLTVAYNMDVGDAQGPFPTQLLRQGNSVIVTLDLGRDHLDVRSITSGYELCCSSHNDDTCMTSGTWQAAPMTSYNMTHVVLGVACGEKQHVTGLRYEWRESPCALLECALYRVENNLPAPSFTYSGLIG